MLEVRDLVKTFDGVHAVDGLSFDVPDDAVLGMIGVNGSGKTTTLNCICGLTAPSSGSIRFDDREIAGLPAHEIMHLGLGRTFQVPQVFNRMTLTDNLLVPVFESAKADSTLQDAAEACLEAVNLAHLRHNFAEELSGGQQKLLELARLMMFQPGLVLLDEPFAGVNPSLCMEMMGHIERMRAMGTSFILVSHDLTSIYRLSTDIVVLNAGRIIAHGDAGHVKSHPDVIEAYLGI